MDAADAHARTGPLLFLSHAGADVEAARRLKRRIEDAPEAREQGLKVWFDKDDLVPGGRWQAQLEEAIERRATAFAVYIGASGVVNWVDAEVRLALSRALASAGRFPFIPVIGSGAAGSAALPGFARQFQGVTDVENRQDEFRKLLATALGRGGEVAGNIRAEPRPFFGLRAIDEKRNHLFFGREGEIEELVRRLRRTGLLVVVGDSGSGKSSLVKAGLVPRWRGGALAAPGDGNGGDPLWHVVELRPGRSPRRALGEAVFAAAGALGLPAAERAAFHEWAVGDHPERRAHGLRCGLDPQRTRTLLVVDQFEELVTLTPQELRRPFVRLLLELADPAQRAFRVVLTMRRGYYNLLSTPECRALHDYIESDYRHAQFPLGRMSDEGLRRIVTEPLALAGVRRDEREALAEAVLADVGERPGDLALVQFALTRAWDRRHEFGGDLLHAYARVGRVEGALAGEAERVFEEALGGEANAGEVAATLIRLARLEPAAGPTRRIARRREFWRRRSAERWDLLQRLAGEEGNRIVLIGGRASEGAADFAAGHETAEIAHEALLTRWPRLHAWLSEAEDDKRTLDRLADRAVEWADAGTDEAKEHRLARTDADREAFEALARARPLWLSEEEEAFVTASTADHKARLERDRLARERERRLRRGATALAAFATVLAVAASAASFAFWRARGEAQEQARIAQAARDRADAHAREADAERRRAEAQRAIAEDGAFRARAVGLANAADREAARGDAVTALLLALHPLEEAARRGAARHVTAEAERAAYDALLQHREAAVLRGHEGAVLAAAFLADGRLATASADKTARVWDAAGSGPGATAAVLRGHEGGVLAVAGLPDGRLVTGSTDRTARIWDPSGRREPVALRGHADPVQAVAVSPDGRRVATASQDGTVRLWDAAGGSEAVLRGHAGGVLALAFAPDGRRLASGSWDGLARVWSLDARRELAVLRGHEGAVRAVAFSPDGQRVATASDDRSVRLWDANGWSEKLRLHGHDGPVLGVAFSPDGRRIATATGLHDRTLRIWDVRDGSPVAALRGHEGEVFSVAFSPDGRRLVSASGDRTARLWDAEPARGVAKLPVSRIYSIAFSPDGRRVATGALDGAARLWDAGTGQEQGRLRGHARRVLSVAFSPDGRRLGTGSADNTARLWEAATGMEAAVLQAHAAPVNAVAFSPDGRRFATASSDRTARLWDAETGRELGRLPGQEEVYAVAFSPDGRLVATGSRDRTARLWDAEAGWERGKLLGHEDSVRSVAFSPDGRSVATASDDRTARLWDAATGQEKRQLRGHEDSVCAVAFSPDGGRLATASSDGTARLWDAETGTELAQYREHEGAVCAIAFSPDGQRLASASREDGIVRFWLAYRSREELVAAVGAKVPRCLSPAQKVMHGLAAPGTVDARDVRQPAPPCW